MHCVIFLTYSTIHRYSPTEAAKVYEKALNRKSGFEFNPARALELIRNGRPNLPLSADTKLEIVQEYLDVRELYFLSVELLWIIGEAFSTHIYNN